jgi:hypothetical protein
LTTRCAANDRTHRTAKNNAGNRASLPPVLGHDGSDRPGYADARRSTASDSILEKGEASIVQMRVFNGLATVVVLHC